MAGDKKVRLITSGAAERPKAQYRFKTIPLEKKSSGKQSYLPTNPEKSDRDYSKSRIDVMMKGAVMGYPMSGGMPLAKNDGNDLVEAVKASLSKKTEKDILPGGLADDKKPDDFNPSSLLDGTKVELEHTNDPNIAREIAMDHLEEDDNYYKKLAIIEGDNHDLEKKQGVPEGVDPDKHERCVLDVKKQGKKVNPYAICSASLGKAVSDSLKKKLLTHMD